jgi:hypothetical protein
MRSIVGRVWRDKRLRYAAAGLAAALVVTGVAVAAVAGGGARRVVSDAPATTVSATDTSTTTTAPAGGSTAPTSGSGPTPTTAPCTTCPPSIPFDLGAAAEPGDFDGRVIVEYGFGERGRAVSDARVGDTIAIGVDIRNSSDHVVNMGSVAVLCATDLTAEGHTSHALGTYPFVWWLTLPPFDPGQQLHDFPRDHFALTADDVGTMTCEAVLTDVGPARPNESRRITRIPPVSFTVTVAPPTTQPAVEVPDAVPTSTAPA